MDSSIRGPEKSRRIDFQELFAAATLPGIRSMGLMAFDPVWAEGVHRCETAEMIHVISGGLRLEMEGVRVEAGPGDTLLIPRHSDHRDVFDVDAGMEVFFCSFFWDSEDAYFEQVALADVARIAPVEKAEVGSLIERMRMDLAGASSAASLVAQSRLLSILLIILRGCSGLQPKDSDSGKSRRRELMVAAKNYMEENYAEFLSLEAIASALHVSGYYLSHVFSGESNFSLFAYLTALRMDKARALLLGGAMNVSQVALAVGYQDPNYFSKAFRKQCGCSPREYAAQGRPGG
jgi:AraC-like DNA-binding protein